MRERPVGKLLITTIIIAILLLLFTQTDILSGTRVFVEGVGEERIETVIDNLNDGERVVMLNRIDREEFNYLVDRVYDNPYLFWIDMQYNALSIGNVSVLIVKEKYDNINAKQVAIDAAANTIIKDLIKEPMSEYNKVLAIHDWICKNVSYEESVDYSDQDIYGALILRKARCAGYAKLFSYLLEMADVESYVVSGESIDKYGNTVPHAWNLVYIDNEPYYFDITWNDNDVDGHTYEWFGITKEEFKMAHFPNNGYEWVEATSEDACYYIKNGMYMAEYSSTNLANHVLRQGKEIFIKCASRSVLNRTIEALGDRNEMQAMMKSAGITHIDKISYAENSYTNCLYITIS